MKIGFIGLGIMGSGMAANVLAKAQDAQISVHNRTQAKAEPLLEQGAHWAERPSAIGDVDILFTMLAHPEAVQSTASGPDGFLAALRPGSLWVDCSTVNPEFSRAMAQQAQAHGVQHLDAPVTGTKPQAESGTLTFFVGGAEASLDTCRPYLEMMGSKVLHIGGHGMGTALKVVINLMLASAMATFAEASRLGQGLGLTQELLFNTLLGGPVAAPFLTAKRPKMEQGDYAAQFPLRWMEKDLRMVEEAAAAAAVELPLAPAVRALYQAAEQAERGEQDFSALYAFLNQG